MGKKLELTAESANELRALAQKMYNSLDEIEQSTRDLFNFYQSVQDDVGSHANHFLEMLEHVKAAKEKMADSISYLPDKMKKTAAKIDQYVARHPGV